MASKDDILTEAVAPEDNDTVVEISSLSSLEPSESWKSRTSYTGTLLYNTLAFLLPALYSTLSKLWVANIDSSMVVTTDIYTYIGVVAECVNEGLPRASWNVIGDRANRTLAARYGLSFTLIVFQSVFGLVLSLVFVTAAGSFTQGFAPVEVREVSVTYTRIQAFSAMSSAMETAVAASTRALDKPDVPLLISSAKFAINIVLDLLVISKFHVGDFAPTVNMQAAIHMACNMAAAVIGLVYFLLTAFREQKKLFSEEKIELSLSYLKALARPGALTLVESCVRNALYLWLVHGIVAMGSDYATAWGVFSSIRWGLIMVPVQALEATSLTFIGHNWGEWRGEVGSERKPRLSYQRLRSIVRPALVSCGIALCVEVPLCIFLSEYGARRFGFFLSESEVVAQIVEKMWKTIDWCYIFYALSTQLATILLATRPRWYLYQSLISNLLWVLPWAIVVKKVNITPDDAWTYHSIIFGGSLVFSFFDVLMVEMIWAWRIVRGRMRLPPVY